MKKAFFVIFIFIFSFISIYSLLRPGLPPTHDAEYHVIRGYQFNKTLRDGDLYPRWLPDLNSGYGIPLMNYYYPLPYYGLSLFHFFGVSFIDGVKLSMIVASFVGAIFMYLWTRQFFGSLGGFVASVFYTYSPYHFLDIYIRGSIGEVWALGFFPVFLWSITKYLKERSSFFIPISSLILSLIIFSHNILALMFFPLAISYTFFLTLISPDKKRSNLFIISSSIFLLSLGISAVFWVPAIFERGYVVGLEIYNYKSHFVELYQLIFPSWGSGFSGDSTTEGLSFQIGIANFTAIIIAFLFLLIKSKKKQKNVKIRLFFILWTILAIALTLSISKVIWEYIPFMKYFQFPWRFLSIIILCCSFLAGSIVTIGKGWRTKTLSVVLILLSFLLGIGYANSPYHHLRDDNYYITRSNFIDGTNTPGDVFNTIWFNKTLKRESKKFVSTNADVSILIHPVRSTEYKASIVTNDTVTILANTAYFPGWQAFVDGEGVETGSSEEGTIKFTVPRGEHTVLVKLTNTQIRNIATLISFAAFTVILTFFMKIIYTRVRKNNENSN